MASLKTTGAYVSRFASEAGKILEMNEVQNSGVFFTTPRSGTVLKKTTCINKIIITNKNVRNHENTTLFRKNKKKKKTRKYQSE